MKKIFTIVLLSFCAIATGQPLDKVIAIVDDDVVLASELKERVEQVIRNFKNSGKDLPSTNEINQRTLDSLIVESIQLQIAQRAGVRISDAQLNNSLQRIAQQNRMSLPQFKDALERDGISYNATREQVRRDMILQQVQQGSVNRRVQITEQEIKNFLASEEGKNLASPDYRIIYSLIPVAAKADAETKKRARQYAESAFNDIQNGTDYRQAIKSNSEFNITSGDLGWRKVKDIPSLFVDAAINLDKGETAPPIESASGFHLLKLVDKRGEGEVIPQTKARHILLKPSAIRDEEATIAKLESIRQRIIAGEDFAELAREFSEDIGSAVEGGDLGWTNPGQLVGAFQDAMDNTKRNEISNVFRSQFGFHILQVLERREKDVTNELRSNIARNYLFQRKFSDELDNWLQKIRDEAYIDFK